MKRLLLVDDEPAVLHPMTRYFARMGYDVTSALDKDEAFRCLGTEPFDVVILDLRLGGDSQDGLDVLRRIHDRWTRTPVLVLSGLVTAEMRAELAQRGAGAILQKPQALADIARVAAALSGAAQPANA